VGRARGQPLGDCDRQPERKRHAMVDTDGRALILQGQRCADRTIFGVGGGAIIGAFEGSDTRSISERNAVSKGAGPAQRLEICTGGTSPRLDG
jgi:hypothetical protein